MNRSLDVFLSTVGVGLAVAAMFQIQDPYALLFGGVMAGAGLRGLFKVN